MVDAMLNKNIKEISKKVNLSEEEIKKILEEVTKPLLTNTCCGFDSKFGVGSSDKVN